VGLGVKQNETEQVVELLVQVHHQVLGDPYVHPHHIIQHFYAKDSERQDRLRQHDQVVSGRWCRRFKRLIARQKQRSDHLYDAEQFSALKDVEYVLGDFGTFLIDWSRPSIDRYHRCESLQKSDTFKQEERQLA